MLLQLNIQSLITISVNFMYIKRYNRRVRKKAFNKQIAYNAREKIIINYSVEW